MRLEIQRNTAPCLATILFLIIIKGNLGQVAEANWDLQGFSKKGEWDGNWRFKKLFPDLKICEPTEGESFMWSVINIFVFKRLVASQVSVHT